MGKKVSEQNIHVEQANGDSDQKLTYEDKVKFASVIAHPMASKKLNKKIIKLVRKAKENKTNMKYGLKDVQRRIRKGDTGIVVFAGDVTPIDVMCHMPGVCEEKNIPYCYIPSKKDLAVAVGFANSCLMVLVQEHPDYKEIYDECYKEFKELNNLLM